MTGAAQTTRIVSLERSIKELLAREKGKRLTSHQIADRLFGNGIGAADMQHLFNVERELAKLCGIGRISHSTTPPEWTYWIESVRDDGGAR